MNKVGVYGGGYSVAFGNRDFVQLFFSIVESDNCLKDDNDVKHYILDRLYRRYIKEESLGEFVKALKKVESAFKQITVGQLDEATFNLKILNITQEDKSKTLGELFARFFQKFTRVVESTQAHKEDWGEYLSVRMIVTDIPACITHEDRSDEELDNLAITDPPFWIRD